MVLAGSSVRENSLVPVKIRSFTAIVVISVYTLISGSRFNLLASPLTWHKGLPQNLSM